MQKKKPITMTRAEIHDLPINVQSLEESETVTLKQYFHMLLLKLWISEEVFDGRRPWGNSGWTYDVFVVLIKNGLIPGKIDDEGFVKEVDVDEAKAFVITEIINPIFNITNPDIKK